MKTPLVTVLMPCYNASEFLKEALQSVIHQSYRNLEILCIDDGSTDDTLEIMKSFRKKDTRIRIVVNESNLKLIATLNKGVNLANGEFIARMDADDISNPERIELLLKELTSKNADLVSSNFQFINEESIFLKKNLLRPLNSKEIAFASFFFTPICHAGLLGKKSIFLKHPYSTNQINFHCEDYELWTRMIRSNVKIYNLNEAMYSIRINSSSVSYKFENIQKENFTKCVIKHWELSGYKYSDDEIKKIANRFDGNNSTTYNQAKKTITKIAQNFGNTSTIKLICSTQMLDILISEIKLNKRKFISYINISLLIIKNFHNSRFRKYTFIKLRPKK